LGDVVVDAILRSISYREADASWAFKVQDIGFLVPREGVLLDEVLTVINNERTVLLEETEQRGAAWATIEPNDNRVIIGIRKRGHKNVVQALGR
jgi:hypothetical protein